MDDTTGIDKKDLQFVGFDGNNEGEMLSISSQHQTCRKAREVLC